MSDVLQFADNPTAFRDSLLVDVAEGLVPFGQVRQPFQDEVLADLDSALTAVSLGQTPPTRRIWWEATKGAGKDFLLAVCMLWLIAFSPRRLRCQAGAADKDQAAELRLSAESILHNNPWLADWVQVQNYSIVNVHKALGSRCDIVAADVAGSHGARPDVLILNELTHIDRQAYAENLMDNAAKVPGGVVVIATNAGHLETWQHRWREIARTSDQWAFHKYDQPAPWLSPADIDEARRRNTPSRFARLWNGVWTVGGVGDALDPNLIAAATDQPCRITVKLPGHIYVGGLDIAVRRDWAAFVTLAIDIENRAIRLADVQVWSPRDFRSGQVDLGVVEEAILHADRQFGLYGVYSDSYQTEYLRQRLEGRVWFCIINPTVPNLTMQTKALLRGFQEKHLHLWSCQPLLRDLGKTRIVERLGGGLKLDADRDIETGHADSMFALAVAMPAALMLVDYGPGGPDGTAQTETTFGHILC